jgi:hypothetical protein
MATNRRRNLPPLSVIGLMLFLPVLYVGSYAALVIRVQSDLIRFERDFQWDADYRIGGIVAHTIFAPAHWADRRLRPAYW